MQLKTDYKIENIPHAEHPAPQRMRNNWLNLNGKWQFGKVKIDEEPVFETEILVPFSPETLHSGIPAGFQLGKNEKLLYRRYFQLDSTMLLGKTVLHFGAVDSHAEVWVNGEKVGEHDCGFTAFSFDVTACVKSGQNEILVTVTDNFKHGARGKQSDKRGGIWYTAQSGIWQTVWLESMPQNHIDGLRFDVNAEEKTVKISTVDAMQKTIVVYDGADVILSVAFK
jgi:beta-galactosidase/beta-glucuronidase